MKPSIGASQTPRPPPPLRSAPATGTLDRMDATFVRVPGARDRIYVRRSDGTEVSWDLATYGDNVPHDLVHLVVESAFGLQRGFWGLVDSGIDPARVNAVANRQGGADKYAAFGGDQREILLAEALAAALSQTLEEPSAVLERQGVQLELDEGVVERVRAELRSLTALWRSEGKVRMRFP